MLHKELRSGEYGTNTLFDNTQPWFRGRVTGDTHDRLRLDPVRGVMFGDGTSGEPVSLSEGLLDASELAPSGATAETIPRGLYDAITDQASILTSGTVQVTAISLSAGVLVSNITVLSGTTAASGPTHCWFALLDSSRHVLAVTADNTTGAWAANTALTLALAAAFTTTYTGLYYVAVMATASSTVPSLAGTAAGNAAIMTLAPILAGTSSTGQTTPPALATQLTALTAGTQRFYAYLS